MRKALGFAGAVVLLVAGLELLDVRATGLREFVGGFAMTAAVLLLRGNLR